VRSGTGNALQRRPLNRFSATVNEAPVVTGGHLTRAPAVEWVERSLLDGPAVPAVVLTTRDITERCDLEASLLVANARVAELEKQLTEVATTERKYLAAELHDDVQQILFGLRLNMAPSRREFIDQLPTELVGGWIQIVQTAIDHLHKLTVVLSKPQIDNRSLPEAMRSYLDMLPLAPEQNVSFETDTIVGTLAPNVAQACFRIVQQALGNAVQHSGARNLWVRLKSSADRLTVSIRDDGVGFDVDNARAHAIDAGGIGLSSMRERAVMSGGHFDIQSSIGQGTRIRASFPLETVRYVKSVSDSVKDGDQVRERFVGVLEDVTERRLAMHRMNHIDEPGDTPSDAI
jgi:signal transduction histidine kinase